ncbi:MAG: hypothetical protein KJ047_05275 [Anaerolineae bacterium]|nr:hypothetical protein [Anaerolineae bacterium]
MPWVDDVLDGLQVQIDKLWYDLLRLLALAGWTLQKGLFMMGHAIELANLWLVENAFAPLITQTNNQMRVTASLAFVIALMVLGITYMLAAFVKLDVVSPRGAIGWYLAGIVFFQLGPLLYQGMNDFRRDLSTGFYTVALDSMQSAGSPFSSLGAVTSSDLPPLEACDALGPYLPGATGFSNDVDGLDIALAYLLADGQDVMGYPPPTLTTCYQPRGALYDPALPTHWQFYEDSYFYVGNSSQFFGDPLNEEERKASIDKAGAAQFRIFSAWPMVIFGVVEQLIFLLLTIAQGLTFVSFSIAILFAFFKKTEVIARSILDMWIELIVQTVVIALMQSLIISFLLGAAATQNALVVLGVSLLCTIFILVLLWSGIKAVWNSFNRLFGAIGQATGGVMVAPGAVGLGLAGAGVAAGVGATAAAVNVGSSALAGVSAMQQGATVSQTAGVMLGGSRRLQSAARTLAYLPGTRNTPLGQMADEFTEGSMLRQVGQSIPVVGGVAGPVIGAHLLSDRSERPSRGHGYRLPAEPEPVDETNPRETPPNRPRRMGTFTPLPDNVPPPAVIRPPVAAGDPGEEIEERVSDVGASVRSHAGQTRAAADRVQHGTDTQGEEVEERVSAVGADVRSEAGQAKHDQDRAAYASDMHGEEVEDRIATLGATLQTGQTQPVMGLMRVEGADNVAGVMGDFIAQTRVQRTLDDQPMTGGADHFTVAQGVARAMGVTPEPDDRAPVQGDVSRLGLFGDMALRLGMTGQQAQTVITEVKNSPTGELTPPTRTMLVEQARGTLNTGWEGAERAVSALQRAAVMLPNAITARGTAAVPNVTVTPNVQVQVNAPASPPGAASSGGGLDDAMKSQAGLAGSQIVPPRGEA